jgi:hypothetical protein
MDDTVDDAHINSIHPILGKLFFCPPSSVSFTTLYIFLHCTLYYNYDAHLGQLFLDNPCSCKVLNCILSPRFQA